MSHISPFYEIALCALEDLYEDIQQVSNRMVFQSRPATAVRIGQQAAFVKAAIQLLKTIETANPIPPQDRKRLVG